MKLLGKIIGVIILCCVLLFLGTCYFQNCREDKPPQVDTPETAYRVTVKATGNVYFSDKVEVFGTGDKELVYMHGYWENVKGKYVFKNLTLPLDERYFGEIEVKKNGKN